MKKINLVYWHDSEPNFGDLLSRFIVFSLVDNVKIIDKDLYILGRKARWLYILRVLFLFDFRKYQRVLKSNNQNLMCIGSILHYSNSKTIVWGSGFMRQDQVFNGKQVFAVRGPLTMNMLLSQGYGVQRCVLGDPAVLLPLIVNPPHNKTHRVGIIPHFTEYNYFNDKYGDKYLVIDLRSENIISIVSQIVSCETIISTSLHGIIVAHSYGVPALWAEYSGLEEGTGGFKFYDYFSSVGISRYSPIKDIDRVLNDHGIFRESMHCALPQIDISKMQIELLKSAPFPLKNTYKKLLGECSS